MRRINTSRLAGIVIGTALLLAGCASQVTSEVTRFHRATPPQGESIAIVPSNKAMTGSLEFARYAALVANKLSALGYTVVTSGKPQLYAKMNYSVGPGEMRIRSWNGNYVHYHFYYGHPYPFYMGSYWDGPSVYAYTVYPRNLNLDIVKATDGMMIFEGKVKSYGREDNLSAVMPYLIDAMFQNFPGESGVTRVVTITKRGDSKPW